MQPSDQKFGLPPIFKSALICAPCATVFSFAPARAGDAPPSVHAIQSMAGASHYYPGTDAPLPSPNIPPMDQIPPAPMGEDPGLERFEFDEEIGPGWGVFYNPATGEEIEMRMEDPALGTTFGYGGGSVGADGKAGREHGPVGMGMNGNLSRVYDVGTSPWRMNVKILINHGDDWSRCSGTMRDAETVLTAGHCVYSLSRGWAKEIYVLPGYDGEDWAQPPDDSVGAYGWGKGTYFGSWSGWTNGGDVQYDVGIIGVTRAVGILTGWFGWVYGGACSWHLGTTYNSASYPVEDCGSPGLHNGLDMYYWSGKFDSCPGNRLEIDTIGGCFNAVWGGMSGSGAYYLDGDRRYVHAICTTSNRSTYGRFVRQWDDWVNWNNGTFIPTVRGSSFDLQPLDVNAAPTTIAAGEATTTLNHRGANPTNGSASGRWEFRVYLSNNDNITTKDTYLGTQSYTWDYSAVSSVKVHMGQVTIPADTPAGDYWLGVLYADNTDGNIEDNDTDGWDAAAVTITERCALATVMSDYPSSVARGETLAFTAAAENDCNGARSFDAAVMSITGPAEFERELYSGADFVVAAGSSVSASVRLVVPKLAIPGIYTTAVSLSLDGDEISSESFQVTVK